MKQKNAIIIIAGILFSLTSLAQENVTPVTIDSNPYSEEVYSVVDEAPKFPGGKKGLLDFFKKNSHYKVIARKENDKGKSVYVNIVLDENGKIWDYKIILGVNNQLDSESIRLIKKMPKWKPGVKNGIKVKTSYTLEIRYESS